MDAEVEADTHAADQDDLRVWVENVQFADPETVRKVAASEAARWEKLLERLAK